MIFHKKMLLLTLAIMLLATLGSTTRFASNQGLPTIMPANAAPTCPPAGMTNPCVTVSLDANSRPTKTATATCAVPVGQFGVCDGIINPSVTNVTTFRVGAVLNATGANSAVSVYGWQFGIAYDSSIVTPQGDPSGFCLNYPDCAEKTVWFGSQQGTGVQNWAAAVATSAGSAFIAFKQQPSDSSQTPYSPCPQGPSMKEILISFVYLAANGPQTVGATSKIVLANVAFEIVSKGTASLAVCDVKFVDSAGVRNPNVIAAPAPDPTANPPRTCISPTFLACGVVMVNANNNPPIASFTTTHTGTSYTFTSTSTDADAGDTLSYVWDFGDKSPLDSGATVTHDYGPDGPGQYLASLRVTDALGSTGAARASDGTLIVNNGGNATSPQQPSHASTDLGLVEIGPTAAFTFSPSTGITTTTSVNFDGGSSSYPDEPVLAGTAPVGGSFLATSDASGAIGYVDNDGNIVFTLGFDTVCRDNDADGLCTSATDTIMVQGTGPYVDASPVLADPKISFYDVNGDGTWQAGEPVIYDTNGNTVYDGIKTYDWNFGDTTTGSGVTTSHTYAAGGTYTVTLTVTDNLAGTNSVSHSLIVAAVQQAHSTSTTVNCSPSPAVIAQGVTCTATVTDTSASPMSPNGSVAFSNTGTATGSFAGTPCTLVAGASAVSSCSATFTATALPPTGTGTLVAHAVYTSSDTTKWTGSAGDSAAVTITKRGTTTAVACTPSTVFVNQATSCTVTVTDTSGAGATPTGTVTFSATATCNLSGTGATASCSVTVAPSGQGTLGVSAAFPGDAAHLGSSGNTIVTVNPRTTSTTVACTPSTVVVGQATSCSATVADTAGAGSSTTPEGTVTFTPGGPCSLSGGTCSVSITPTASGPLSVSASYGGSTVHAGSTGSTSVTVNKRSTSTAVTCAPSSITTSQSSTCTATVTDTSSGSATTLAGTVTFSTNLGSFSSNTCALSGGSCFVTFSSTTGGSASISASFAPTDTTHLGSATTTSATVDVGAALAVNTPTVAQSTLDSGQSTTLSATFTGGTAPYMCQWLQKAPGATSFTSLGTAAPCTSPASTLTDALTTTGAWQFEVQVTDGAATTITSTPVTVTVNAALVVNTPTAAASTLDSGQSTTLQTTFTGGTSPFTCQWIVKPPGASVFSNLGSFPACTSPASVSTGTLAPSGAWSFELQVTDSAGTPSSVTSGTVVLTVNPALTAPVISASPATITSGQSSTLSTTSSFTGGTSPYMCQWLQKAPGASSFTNLGSSVTCTTSGPLSASTGALSTTGTWSFQLQVTDGAATPTTVTSTAITVTVNAAVQPDFTITASPTSVTSQVGSAGPSTITVTAQNSFTGMVSLGVTTSSTSLVCTLSQSSFNLGTSSTSTLSCTGSEYGSFTATVTGADSTETLSHSATVTFTITDFNVSANPTRVTVKAGATGTSTITISPVNGFTGQVNLGSSVSPSTGLTCTLSNTSVILSSSGTSTLSCTGSAGNYTVIVTGTAGTLSHTVTVSFTVRSNQPPTASFTVTPTTAPTGTPVSVDASASVDPDGTIASYAWNFGDSTTDTGVTTTHTYTAAGNYTITLTVTDDSGTAASATHVVVITNRPPLAMFSFSPTNPVVGQSVTFTSTSTDPDGTITTSAWNFGDGTTGSGATATHAYSTAGTFNVTLTVTDNNGASSSIAHTINVSTVVVTGGHAELEDAFPQFRIENLRRNPTQTLYAEVENDGNISVYVYVRFDIKQFTVSGTFTTTTLYTRVVQLAPDQEIEGTSDSRMTVQFNPTPGAYIVKATVYYSPVSSTIGDPSFKPDTDSSTRFAFLALGAGFTGRSILFLPKLDGATGQTFTAQVVNQSNVNLLVTLIIKISNPDGTRTIITSTSTMTSPGQTINNLTIKTPVLTRSGNYCFNTRLRWGMDTNGNGILDGNETLGTQRADADNNCFTVSTSQSNSTSPVACDDYDIIHDD